MSESTVAIIGSGIVGTTIACQLTQKGHDVTIFEKGPEYPYPHTPQFVEEIHYLYSNPVYRLPPDLQDLVVSGNYSSDLDDERHMVVGGTATQWAAVTPRIHPNHFKTKTLYGRGEDWPLTYDVLEPYYCRAEALLGVSGTDADNPYAPWRSKPYPLPPFDLGYDDAVLAERLRKHGILLHTTPQARTRAPYQDRPGCQNFGVCYVCPIGARYSPNEHLRQAIDTRLCTVQPQTSVRRIVLDQSGRARAIVYRPNDATTDREHSAKVIIVAAGTIESARLLLLSTRDRHPDGLPNDGHIGQHLMFHHGWMGRMHYKGNFFPGRLGPYTGQCQQFVDPTRQEKHMSMRIGFSSNLAYFANFSPQTLVPGSQLVETLKRMRDWRIIVMGGESLPSPRKYVALADRRDRFGDPFAHVHHESADFDHETYQFARELFDRFVTATGADDAELGAFESYSSGAHHMGTCRMGLDRRDSVVDSFGKFHGVPNLFVVGGSSFASTGAAHPTLTMAALAFRTADYILDQLL